MKLEIAEFPVSKIRLGHRFSYENQILDVDEGALIDLTQEDPRITDATLAVATPGEKTRVTGIRDIVEPRHKVSGNGQVFPGVLSAVENVGDRRTHRLSGMAVVAAAEYEGTIRAGTTVPMSAILDMAGPGAEVSRFSAYVHLVISFRIVPGLGELDTHDAIQSAEYKVAQRLAQTTAGLSPAKLSTYDLGKKNPHLPNVFLVQGCITDPQHVHSGVGYYGLSLRNSIATFVHPNELIDGAVTVDTTRSGRGYYPTTWDWQNHPLVLELYAAHGKSLNFGGVILQRIRFETHHGKEGKGCPVAVYLPEADAVVSTGSLDKTLELPAMDKVIGPYDQVKIFPFPGAAPVPARGALSLEARDVMMGGADIWGQGMWKCAEY